MREGDFGTTITMTIRDTEGDVVDISTASTKEIVFTKPSATEIAKTAVFATDGTDGRLRYVIEEGLLSEVGQWKRQALAVLSSGTWRSQIVEFEVGENL